MLTGFVVVFPAVILCSILVAVQRGLVKIGKGLESMDCVLRK